MPETTQPAPDTDEKKSRGLGSYVVWAFVTLMVYVLSSGPVLKVAQGSISYHPAIGGQMLTIPDRPGFYAPLWWLYDHPPCHKPLGMYWHLWRPDQYDTKGEFRDFL